MIYQNGYPVTEIILHTSATRPDWMAGHSLAAKVQEIDRWHRSNGWRGIGYHYVIDRDGKVAKGREEAETGAHVRGHNTGTIGVCILGGFGGSADDTFDDHYTPEQRVSVSKLIRDIASRTDIRKVTGHNQYAAKACPCFVAASEFPWPPAYPDAKAPLRGFWAALWALLKRILSSLKHKGK